MAFSICSTMSRPFLSNNTRGLVAKRDVSTPSKSVTFIHNATKGSSWVSVPAQKYMNDLYQMKLEEVRRVLHSNMAKSPVECLKMIDTLQRLATDYHFQEDIEDFLSSQYTNLMDANGVMIGFNADDHYSMFSVSLYFRLLRQNGYRVSPDVFTRFMDDDGKFREEHCKDLRGMMGLYQASQFRIEGEDILEQANAFASKNLRDCMRHVSQGQSGVIKDSLDHPYHTTLARFNVKKCVENYENEHGTDGVLFQELAKMDFNNVQSLHQRELVEVSLWWRDLGLARKLNFARDQPTKWYIWSMTTLTDPIFSEQRIELTKPISLVYMMDDVFDVYGTLEELELFTEAINTWEADNMEGLPSSMNILLKALYDITEEISDKILKSHGWDPTGSLRKAWARLCNAFLVEAKWFASGDLPTAEEYLKNGVISTGVHVIFVHLFFLLGQGINKECVDLVDNIPGLIFYPAMILRLWDDLGSAKDENQQGYDGSYIECYLKEHRSSTIESAKEHVFNLISNTWKKLNEEYLSPSPFSLSLKKASLNAARMVCLMYNYDENQRLPSLEKHIKSLLYESIPLHNN